MNIAQRSMKRLYLFDSPIAHQDQAMAKASEEICKGGTMGNQANRLTAAVLLLAGVLVFTTGCSDMIWGENSGNPPTGPATQAKGLSLKLDAEQAAQAESSIKSYQDQTASLQKVASENQTAATAATQRLNQLNAEVAQVETERQTIQAAMPAINLEIANIQKELSPLQSLFAAKKEVSERTQKIAKFSAFDLLADRYYMGNSGELAKLEKAEAYVKANPLPKHIADDIEALNMILVKEQSLKEAQQRLTLSKKRLEVLPLSQQITQNEIEKQKRLKESAELGAENAKAQLSKVGNRYDQQYKVSALNLYREYSQASAVTTKKVISVIHDLHLREASMDSSGTDLDSVLAKIQQVANTAAGIKAANPWDFKLAVDAVVDRHGNNGTLFNYTGTTLFLILNEMRQNPIKDMVVIFVKGHTLPGYIKMEGGRHVLRGLEMTAQGQAIVDFGFTANVSGDIRVVDANQYLLVEALRPLNIANLGEVYKQMSQTTKNWDFAATSAQELEQAPLSFGPSEVHPGKVVRPKFDLIRYDDYAATMAVQK